LVSVGRPRGTLSEATAHGPPEGRYEFWSGHMLVAQLWSPLRRFRPLAEPRSDAGVDPKPTLAVPISVPVPRLLTRIAAERGRATVKFGGKPPLRNREHSNPQRQSVPYPAEVGPGISCLISDLPWAEATELIC
jgi:hypothetical protein